MHDLHSFNSPSFARALLLIGLLFAPVALARIDPNPTKANFVKGKFIVEFNPSASSSLQKRGLVSSRFNGSLPSHGPRS